MSFVDALSAHRAQVGRKELRDSVNLISSSVIRGGYFCVICKNVVCAVLCCVVLCCVVRVMSEIACVLLLHCLAHTTHSR